MGDAILFALGLFALGTLVFVRRPIRRPGELAVAFFPWSWLAGELPAHLAALLVVPTLVLVVWADGLDSLWGWTGLILVGAGLVSAALSWREGSRALRLAAAAGGIDKIHTAWWRYALPWWFADRAVVRTFVRDGGVVIDRYEPRAAASTPRPLLVYIHGGGWVLGFRRWQGRVLIRRLVRAGWVVASIEYRRWPRVTWPGPRTDVESALAMIRAKSVEWNVDRMRIFLSGNSAGGHLAALVALTDRHSPPLAGCLAWYAVYDLVDEARLWPHGALERLWSWLIMRQPKRLALDRWRDASPVAHLHAAAPPFMIIHGSHDSLVPVAVARDFVNRLERATGRRPEHFEVEGAQHAFDVFTSRRGAAACELAAAWLERVSAASPNRGSS